MLEEGGLADVGLAKAVSPEIVREGLLVKRGHVRKNWKTRWCILSRDGLLTYFRPRSDRNSFEGIVLGAIYLNGATFEDHGRMVVLKTSQGKDFPLRPPKGVAETYFREWKELIREYTERPFTPGTITMATYAPPPALGGRGLGSSRQAHSSEDHSFSFSCRASHRGGEGDKANFLIKSTVSLPSIAPTLQEGSVSRTLKELRQFRDHLIRLYPGIIVPPVNSKDVEVFLQRVASHSVLRYAPEFHQLLNLLNTTQMRDRIEFEKQRKYEESVFTGAVGSTRGGFFGSTPKFQFTDSIVPKLEEMKQHVTQVSGHLNVVRTHFSQSQKHEREAAKTSEAAQKAFGQLGEINTSLHRITTELVATLQEISTAGVKASQESAFGEGLSEYLEFVLPSFDRAIERRRSLLLAYQLGVSKVNTEKMALLEFIRNSSFADPRRSSRVGTDRPTQMKRLQAKVENMEASTAQLWEFLDLYSAIFGEEVTNYPRWFFFDFRAMCLQYVHQQINYHQSCLNSWNIFLPRIQAIDPTRFENPFEDWWLSLPSPPTEAPVSVTLPAVDVRNHPSYRASSATTAYGLTEEDAKQSDASTGEKKAVASSSNYSSDPPDKSDRQSDPYPTPVAAYSSQPPMPPPDEDSDDEFVDTPVVPSYYNQRNSSPKDTPVMLWHEPDMRSAEPAAISQPPTQTLASGDVEHQQPPEIVAKQFEEQDATPVATAAAVVVGAEADETAQLSVVKLDKEEPVAAIEAGATGGQLVPAGHQDKDGAGFENSGSSSDTDSEEFFSSDDDQAIDNGAIAAASSLSSSPSFSSEPKKASLAPLGVMRNVPGAVPVFRARALFSYTAQQAHQISLEPGQIVRVEGKHDGGWWSGVDETTLVRGYLPGAYMEEVEEPTVVTTTNQ